jgi:hypothetical protein
MSADEHLRHWLAEGMTGCQFAKLIAQSKDRIVTATRESGSRRITAPSPAA